jgi:hypothetical protein
MDKNRRELNRDNLMKVNVKNEYDPKANDNYIMKTKVRNPEEYNPKLYLILLNRKKNLKWSKLLTYLLPSSV